MITQSIKEKGLAFVRIVTGLLMAYHGIEVFNASQMQEYAKWDMFKDNSMGLILVYLGKGSELVSGILLTLGFYTRLASIILVITMLAITFFIGHGKFWYEDQHPFLFVLLALVYFFNGAGIWSLDERRK